jgi:predicted HTH domain antitoxin
LGNAVIEERISALIRSGVYESKEDFIEDAYRALMETKPNLNIEAAIELYKEEKISLCRGAEISGLPIDHFKEALARRGIKIIVEP